MSLAISSQNLPEIMSSQMRAVLAIFTADPALMSTVEPFVDFMNEEIEWDKILKIKFAIPHKVLINVAYGIWMDKEKPNFYFFDDTLKLETNLKAGILRALAFRWGLKP